MATQRPVILNFVILSVVASCGGSGDSNQAPLDYEANPASARYDFAEVDSVIEAFLEEYSSVGGVTLAVVHRDEGQIYEKGYGDFERSRISLITSTGKILAAGVILALADDGILDLDRPVAEYLNWGDHHAGVTMRHLLSMMSGIPGDSGSVFYEAPCVQDTSTTLPACGQSVFRDESLSIPPGQEFRYSGGAWQLAGAVAEVVSKLSWAELVEQRLVAPCGLSDTGFAIEYPSYPSDFGGDPNNLPETANPNLGGGAYSTVNDYSKVLLMHLRSGLCGGTRVLSEAAVQAMREDLVPEGVEMPFWRPEAINYGLGWWKYDDSPGLLIDSGAFGARALLHPGEGWGAIMILETESWEGRELRMKLVPALRSAIADADPG